MVAEYVLSSSLRYRWRSGLGAGGAGGKNYVHSDISHKEHLDQLKRLGREL